MARTTSRIHSGKPARFGDSDLYEVAPLKGVLRRLGLDGLQDCESRAPKALDDSGRAAHKSRYALPKPRIFLPI